MDADRRRAARIDPTGIDKKLKGTVCGPAAIYSGLVEHGLALRDTSFSAYITQVVQADNLTSLVGKPGMNHFRSRRS